MASTGRPVSDLDDIARLVNPQADQGQAAAAAWAHQVSAYHRALLADGVELEVAALLTRDYQGIYLHLLLPRLSLGGG